MHHQPPHHALLRCGKHLLLYYFRPHPDFLHFFFVFVSEFPNYRREKHQVEKIREINVIAENNFPCNTCRLVRVKQRQFSPPRMPLAISSERVDL